MYVTYFKESLMPIFYLISIVHIINNFKTIVFSRVEYVVFPRESNWAFTQNK